MCSVDFFLAYQQFFVVGNCQCTATIQAQCFLGLHGEGQVCQTDETEELPDIDLEEEETQTNEEVAMEITPEDDQNAETEEDFQ